MPKYDLAIVGGGILGLATAMHLAKLGRAKVVVLEKEDALARHQTGNNSGVIHSGLYYMPGSLKATNCVAGRDALYRFCAVHDIPHERCGKVVVALDEEEIPRLDELERRGRANGLQGLRRLGPEEIREREPHVAGIAGLEVQETGIVDYVAVTNAYADEVRGAGGEVRTSSALLGVRRSADGWVLETRTGDVEAGFLVNCAGAWSDRVARMCGARPDVRIIPFRGEYYELTEAKRHLVRHLVYPVPDPRFPFLGVHFTRMVGGGVEAGPNAVLALARAGYSWTRINPRDLVDMALWGGLWKLAGRHWKTGWMEVTRSLSKARFVAALQRLVPEIRPEDVVRGGAGVRAQAIDRDGNTLDDFSLVEDDAALHVLNAPSPGATASLSIAAEIVTRVTRRLR